MATLLLPSDPLRPARPDEHFAWRADLARDLGWDIALVDSDDLSGPGAFRGVRPGARLVLHGWMVSADRYAELAEAVGRVGAALVTGPGEYARAHHLPGWYDTFSDLTPASVWLGADAYAATLTAAAHGLGGGPTIVKDWVKSRKHEWASACYAPTPLEVPGVAARMLALQGEDLTGGIVLREFEDLRGTEARVWWVQGEPAVVTAHPDTPDALVSPDLTGVARAVRALGCPFVTTDLAQRSDGRWRVVEVGDGQVSDFPLTGDYPRLLESLALV